MGNKVKKETPLETACYRVLGDNAVQYYDVLSQLIILNPQFVRKDDNRLSAKLSSLLFNDEFPDKVHHICVFLENDKLEQVFNQTEIKNTEILLRMDPELKITKEIISVLKELPDPNYSEIMRKVPIKHSQKLYYQGETGSRRRI